MSWKKLLRSAKRLEMPIIIADQEGDDPFVLMPLDHYEMLINEEFEGIEDEEFDSISFVPEDVEMRQGEPDERAAGAFEFIDEMEPETQNLAQNGEKIKTEIVESYQDSREQVVDKGVPLEDRFYFEPLEDQSKK
ncbi:hypothetical protein KKG46_01070 [Patescibacteria group bacterium]|nr:hypothetical protein [Patescibacteria group bacterium]